MSPPRPTELLHILLSKTIQPGDIVIDATCGNGHDTLFLANAVGPNGRVIAIDIQLSAIHSTTQKILDHNLIDRVTTHQTSHEKIGTLAESRSISVIVFNLGYLPGSNHSLITTTPSTLLAVESSIMLLKPNGMLAIICYPGHPGGLPEALAVESLLSSKAELRTAKYSILGTKSPAPFLLVSTKIP